MPLTVGTAPRRAESLPPPAPRSHGAEADTESEWGSSGGSGAGRAFAHPGVIVGRAAAQREAPRELLPRVVLPRARPSVLLGRFFAALPQLPERVGAPRGLLRAERPSPTRGAAVPIVAGVEVEKGELVWVSSRCRDSWPS